MSLEIRHGFDFETNSMGVVHIAFLNIGRISSLADELRGLDHPSPQSVVRALFVALASRLSAGEGKAGEDVSATDAARLSDKDLCRFSDAYLEHNGWLAEDVARMRGESEEEPGDSASTQARDSEAASVGSGSREGSVEYLARLTQEYVETLDRQMRETLERVIPPMSTLTESARRLAAWNAEYSKRLMKSSRAFHDDYIEPLARQLSEQTKYQERLRKALEVPIARIPGPEQFTEPMERTNKQLGGVLGVINGLTELMVDALALVAGMSELGHTLVADFSTASARSARYSKVLITVAVLSVLAATGVSFVTYRATVETGEHIEELLRVLAAPDQTEEGTAKDSQDLVPSAIEVPTVGEEAGGSAEEGGAGQVAPASPDSAELAN